ncbi:MAG: sulfotransferase family protein [Silicimonas sp.]|nr:sulfotransferase family protein [Silicimonas sp.]
MLTRTRQTAGMPSLTLPDRLIWFAHCPKAGGTSVEQFMVAEWGDAVGHLHWGWDLWWKAGGWRDASPPNSPQHLVWKDALCALPCPPDTVFAVVRDPAARLQSEYRWQRRGRRGTRLGRLLARLPFSLWLRLMLAMAARHPHAFDNHLRPQADFVPDNARIFHLEDGLDPVIDWLASETGLTARVAVPHAIPSGANGTLTAGDAARIARAHACDYRRFGYTPPAGADVSRSLADRVSDWLSPALIFLDRRGAL